MTSHNLCQPITMWCVLLFSSIAPWKIQWPRGFPALPWTPGVKLWRPVPKVGQNLGNFTSQQTWVSRGFKHHQVGMWLENPWFLRLIFGTGWFATRITLRHCVRISNEHGSRIKRLGIWNNWDEILADMYHVIPDRARNLHPYHLMTYHIDQYWLYTPSRWHGSCQLLITTKWNFNFQYIFHHSWPEKTLKTLQVASMPSTFGPFKRAISWRSSLAIPPSCRPCTSRPRQIIRGSWWVVAGMAPWSLGLAMETMLA